jgi:hypothetical protein
MSQNIQLARTKESTLYETITTAILLLSLLPSFFSDDKGAWVMALCCTLGCGLACLCVLVLAYTPSSDFLHLGFVDLKQANLLQLLLAARLLRVLALEVALLCLGGNFTILIKDPNTSRTVCTIVCIVMVVAIMVTIAIFSHRIRKAKEVEM